MARVHSQQPARMFDSTTLNLDNYIKFRPAYSEALYAEIYRYHKSQGGQWDFAHDAGTGAGIVAEELAKRFTTVAASDPSSFYIDQAKKRLSASGEASKFRFDCHPGEDMSWLPDASVDMVTMAEAIHWTEHEKVLDSASRALKPGGTLAIWIYGTLPFFVDDSTGAQGILNKISERWFGRIKNTATPDHIARFTRAVRMINLRMDVIQFDEKIWNSGVRRIHWNSNRPPMGTSKVFECDRTLPPRKMEDVVERREDNMIMSYSADANWIQGYMNHLYPDLPYDRALEDMFAELAKVMEATGGKSQLSWTCSLILATKSAKTE
ncbi:hypothetical protein FQN49_005235 [Arthroderma sp. PD_2]|nr:hypothetical protein FQN49_005235 [Arthroderma sp. PD_2]